jgi:iron-only hydrogenase group A
MATITVNRRDVDVRPGEMLLEVLRREGVHVPTLCHLEDMTPTGACRLCVVEVEGARNLVPSCACPVQDGMKIETHTPRAVQARKTVIELLLADHPDDCLYCVRNGNCDLQTLAEQHGVRQRRFHGKKTQHDLDVSSPSLLRDPDKCILCGRCVRVCEEVQGVGAIDFIGRGSQTTVGTAFEQGLNVSSCIYCGQCIMVCPTGALRDAATSTASPTRCSTRTRPSSRSTHPRSRSRWPKSSASARQGHRRHAVAALRRLGFDYVFDTSFSADLTIMEEGSELVQRIQSGGTLPMMTSCSPGWIKFVEEFYPDLIPNLSSCKSPQQMLGAVIKSYWAQKLGKDPKDIYVVSIMPCTAKKFEAQRPEMEGQAGADVDAVLTTRELARMIRMRGLQLDALEPESADSPLGERSSAGKLFAATGGVMEAALRSAYFLLTGENLPELELEAVRGLDERKEAKVDINGTEVGVAVVSSLGAARKLMEEIRAGRSDIHFIEVMTCPGGCINGGGQPLGADKNAVRARMRALYRIDEGDHLRLSHENQSVQKLYEEYLGEPLSEKSHELLHTHYAERPVVI